MAICKAMDYFSGQMEILTKVHIEIVRSKDMGS